MDRVSFFLSLRGRKIPRHKSEPLTPAYRPVSSTASSASCSNNLITPATNLLSTNFSTTANTISQARIADSSLALTHTLISEPIYTSASSSSTPHPSTSTTGIETWAQNLTTPNLHLSPRTFNFSASNPFNQSPPINLKLPSFWEDDIELWLAAVDHQFLLSNISTEQKRFSAILSALDYQVIRKVQNIIRNPGNQPYQTLKQALIKLYKISDDNRLDRLLHQTELGDRKPTELLSELHSLLGESCNVGPDLDKLLRKLFLDRLPPQVRLILAGSPQPTLDLMAQRADDIMATMATTPLNSNPTQLLQNQIFERRLDQLTDAIDASITFHKENNSSSAPRDPQFSRSSHFHQSRPNDSSGPQFRPRREMPSTSRQNNRFSPRPTLRTTSKNLCFFHARFGDQARNCRAPCSWQPRPPRNPIDPNHYRLASHACTSQQKAPTTHRLQPLFHDPCSKMHFLLDTGAYISLIPPCKFYKPYYGPQDLIAANGTRIRIFGTKQLNIDVGARYTLRWTFTVADVTLPIIGTDFLRHFGLGVDVANNAFILPQKSIHSRHQAPRTQSHPIPCISGPNADDTFDSPSTSPRWPDIPHKFPRERHTAFESSNADAANVVSHFVHNLPKIAVDPPLVTDGDVSSILQEPTDPPIQRTLQPPSLSSAQPFDLLKADFLKHKVLARHENNFANTLQPKTITPDVLHTIITTGPPVKTRVRRLSPEQLCFVKREIGTLLDAGVLTPSSSPFASAIHIVPKKQPGQFRMVGDYRALNNITQPDRYPLPLISDAIDSLKGCIIFSKFDCLKGYHQIPVHPADRHKTAIITPIGLFEYTTMPFGLRNSGNTFQRFIDDVIYGLDFCFAYVDDILVASKSLEEHEIHLNILMNRFKTFGLTLHKDKCQIAVPEVQFLGHVINQHGVQPIPNKIHAIASFPKPTNLRGLRRFLGMINYYRRFIPHCAATLRPLNQMLSPKKGKKTSLSWSEEAETAFTDIKTKLADIALLSYPVKDAETAIFVDASQHACGAALQQKINDAWKPLAFFSQNFSPAQTRYATFDKELLGIYLAIRHFRYFIEGRPFTIYTDHAPLCHAITSQSKNSSPRQLRHLDFIAQFTTDLRHLPGSDNIVADCLSRPICAIFEEQLPIDYAAIATAQQDDDSIQSLITDSNSLELSYQPLPGSDLELLGDISWGQFRPIIPASFRKDIFDHFHSLAHPGQKASFRLISSRFFWPGMQKDIHNFCKTCLSCQQSKIQRHTISPYGNFSTPTAKFQHVHVDIVGPLPVSSQHSYILTIVDRYSRWFDAIPLTRITSRACADAFILHFVSRYGSPQTITTDRGRQFTSHLWQSLAIFLGSQLIYTTSHNPKANGLVERFHRVLKAALKAQRNPGDWYSNLGWILLSLHVTFVEHSSHCPAEILYGCPLRLPGEFFEHHKQSFSEDAYVQNLRTLMNQLTATPIRPRSAQKTYINNALFSASHVFIREDGHCSPLQRPYRGPFQVQDRAEKYFVIDINGKLDSVSIDRLKPANVLPTPLNSLHDPDNSPS